MFKASKGASPHFHLREKVWDYVFFLLRSIMIEFRSQKLIIWAKKINLSSMTWWDNIIAIISVVLIDFEV